MLNFNLIEKLKLVFNFGKNKNQKVGALVEGKNTTFINSKASGPDGGLIDRGTNTTAINSEFEVK